MVWMIAMKTLGKRHAGVFLQGDDSDNDNEDNDGVDNVVEDIGKKA